MRLTTEKGMLEVPVRWVPKISNVYVAAGPALIEAGEEVVFDRRLVREGAVLVPRREGRVRPVFIRYNDGVFSAFRGMLHIRAHGEGYPDEQREISLSKDTLAELCAMLMFYMGLKPDERTAVKDALAELCVAYELARNVFKVSAYERFEAGQDVKDALGRNNPAAVLLAMRAADRELTLRLEQVTAIEPRIARREIGLLQLKNDQVRTVHTLWLAMRQIVLPASDSDPHLDQEYFEALRTVAAMIEAFKRLYVEPFISTRDRCAADLLHAKRELARGRSSQAKILMTRVREALRYKFAQIELEEMILQLSLGLAGGVLNKVVVRGLEERLTAFRNKVVRKLKEDGFVSCPLAEIKQHLADAERLFRENRLLDVKKALKEASSRM